MKIICSISSNHRLEEASKQLFEEIGNILKRRRQKDDQLTLVSRIDVNLIDEQSDQVLLKLEDYPAAGDQDLENRLIHNKKVAEEKRETVNILLCSILKASFF